MKKQYQRDQSRTFRTCVWRFYASHRRVSALKPANHNHPWSSSRKMERKLRQAYTLETCVRSASASGKFPDSIWERALLVSAKAVRASATAEEEEASRPSPQRLSMISAAREGVPQWRRRRPWGRATRFGPEPHRPRQPLGLTRSWGDARAVNVSRICKEPCFRQVRLVQTRSSFTGSPELRQLNAGKATEAINDKNIDHENTLFD